jgi:gamma-glutamyl-gamma-aminobutyrate hydrolase PuuD
MSNDYEPNHALNEHEKLYLEGVYNNSDELWTKRNEAHIRMLEKSVQKETPVLLLEHKQSHRRN